MKACEVGWEPCSLRRSAFDFRTTRPPTYVIDMSTETSFQGGPGNLLWEPSAPLFLSEQVAEVAQQLTQQGYAMTPHFLSLEEVHALAKEARQRWTQGAFREAGVGRDPSSRLQAEIRTDRICWLDAEQGTPAQKVYFSKARSVAE